MRPKTESNPKGGGRKRFDTPAYLAQISGLSTEAIEHLRSNNASKYLRELINADIVKKLSE